MCKQYLDNTRGYHFADDYIYEFKSIIKWYAPKDEDWENIMETFKEFYHYDLIFIKEEVIFSNLIEGLFV